MNNEKKAIILAAGLGSRLRPLTNTQHKCMTKVCGVPIVFNALKNLKECGVQDVVIVVGYLSAKLKKEIEAFRLDIHITFIENRFYQQTNTAYSLWCGMQQIGKFEELYIIEGDVFFDISVLRRLMQSEEENLTILEPYNENLEGTFVQLDPLNYVIDWRHKSDQEEGYLLNDKYKTVNLHKFSQGFVNQYLVRELEDIEDKKECKLPFEKIMSRIVKKYSKLVKGEILRGEKWYEIDDLSDLEMAECMFQKK